MTYRSLEDEEETGRWELSSHPGKMNTINIQLSNIFKASSTFNNSSSWYCKDPEYNCRSVNLLLKNDLASEPFYLNYL